MKIIEIIVLLSVLGFFFKSAFKFIPVKWSLSESEKVELKNNYEKLLVNFLAFETICDQWNKIVTKEDDLKKFLIFVKNYKFYD